MTTPTTGTAAAVVAPHEGAAALHALLADRVSPRAFDAGVEISQEDLGLVLEAARWAPSASNTQPARFLVGRRGDRTFGALLAALVPGNREWAADASALVLVAAETVDAQGADRRWAVYDAGQAAAHLTVQAAAIGLAARQMGGFVPGDLPALPEGVTPLVVAAIGVALPEARIPADHPARRLPARSRRPLDEVLLDLA